MSHPDISTFSTINSWLKIVHQGRLTKTRLAFRKGRSVGVRPSMTRSSTWNAPRLSLMLKRPICIGRSRYFEPASSARFFTLGPRSIVSDAAIRAATMAARIAMARRIGCLLFFAAGAAAGCFETGGVS